MRSVVPRVDGILGVPLEQPGVINYDAVGQGLCMGMTEATFATTTEVYPDSDDISDDICNAAQVAAVRAGLDYALATC